MKFFFLPLILTGFIKGHLLIEDITLPPKTPPEIGALCFDELGQLYVATRRNDIFVTTPTKAPDNFKWKLFASGFHNACGIYSPKPGQLLVSQMAELTEVIDSDSDGVADTYNNLSNQIGLSGNYHETNALCPDGKGGFFIAAGTASHNGPTFWNTNQPYSATGRRGRNFSSVQWRGWVMHYNPTTQDLTPFAKGFRMHNGIFLDSKKRLWCGDNQGDFRATSPLYLVKKDHFYGHPSSLVWDPKFPKDQDPLNLPQDKLDQMRTPATVLIPHKAMNRSCADVTEIPKNFGIYPGQLLVADNNGHRITRIMLDEVNGELQGACTHFINQPKEKGGLRSGNNRFTWSPDGKQLYIGQTVRGWGKLAEGLQRISFAGKIPFDVETLKLTKTGFHLRTTLPIKNLSQATITATSFEYRDSHKYGGKRLNTKKLKVSEITQIDPHSFTIAIDPLDPQKVYSITLKNLNSSDNIPLFNRTFYYTANQLIK